MPSDPPEIEEWDAVDAWARRIGRWALVGLPAWLLLLAAFNQELTGIPWIVGLAMATVLAIVAVLVADRTVFAGGQRVRLGGFGRALATWIVVFFVLALILASGNRGGAAVLLIPVVIATIVSAGVELARRATGRD